MIIVKLIGGLGNQMFQYTLGRALANKHKTELFFDTGSFATALPRRQYALDVFNIFGRIANKSDLEKFFPSGIKKLLQRLNLYNYKHIKELQFNFDPAILNLPDNTYLDGYWQSEKYFNKIEPKIRQELTLKDGDNLFDQSVLKSIRETESISLHVRRQDYITDNKISKIHGACSLEYYQQAIKKILTVAKNPQLFIFSDDLAWAKNNLKFDLPASFIEHGIKNDYKDLILMSRCRHNIIANSSFGWWAAWLNQNPDKIIIAPKKWFQNETRDTKDLIPKKWLTL